MTTNDSNTQSAIAAISTIIGYLGSEVATSAHFERLLWPQRFHNGLSWQNLAKEAFLMPMGGPLHKAVFVVVDKLIEHGVFKGKECGNMLGTAFYGDTRLSYTIHDLGVGGRASERRAVRNGFWVRAIDQMSLTSMSTGTSPEDGNTVPTVRAGKAVSLLTLEYEDERQREAGGPPVVHDDTGPVNCSTFLQLGISEATGIAVAIVVRVVFKNPFFILWLLPLWLKIVMAAWTVPREPLARPSVANTGGDRNLVFEVHDLKHGFLLIDGNPSLILQFFRHYGHPVRCRVREGMQMWIVVAFGLLFPAGLLCSIMWMPIGMQYLWLGYQLYATFAMYIYRCLGGSQWASTEERVAKTFADSKDGVLVLSCDNGVAVKAKLSRTYVSNVAEGCEVVRNLLVNRQRGGTGTGWVGMESEEVPKL
ncbi:hypothetical protein K440DRAFT_631368 [Wilcoxina mikolae CBS 423.85]|nr:hypothetical protein K440DRAFT_631368 [Wilcoxina mikolae CBS 423.85]